MGQKQVDDLRAALIACQPEDIFRGLESALADPAFCGHKGGVAFSLGTTPNTVYTGMIGPTALLPRLLASPFRRLTTDARLPELIEAIVARCLMDMDTMEKARHAQDSPSSVMPSDVN